MTLFSGITYLITRTILIFFTRIGSNLFSLVLVNVPKHELVECRKLFIAEAIAPSKTVLDDSLGCVLWFATRMQGIEYETGESMFVC